jgi:phosphohistidine phosphatase
MRRLLLLRHAKSDWPQGVSDFDRPLAGRGVADAKIMGNYMARNRLVPDLALISPAIRTQQTWQILAEELAPAPRFETQPKLYAASARVLLSIVQHAADVSSLMLVAHNPGLEDLAKILLHDAEENRAPKFPTCALAVFDLNIDAWKDTQPGCGRLRMFVSPKAISDD